jgi:hypothetical protein
MVAVPNAIIDACVLYSAPVRDLVVRLAQAGLLQARWSGEIHDEWMRNLLKNNPSLDRERRMARRSAAKCCRKRFAIPASQVVAQQLKCLY